MLIDKVLLATDYSAPSEQLFQCLPELIEFGMKEVVLVHIVDPVSAGGNVPEFQRYNEEKLRTYKEKLEHMNLKVTIRVPVGFVAASIHQIASEESVSLILIGSHGKGIIKRKLLGSTTVDVLRISNIPVLVEKFQHLENNEWEVFCKQKFQKILIPTDFSDPSMEMIETIKETEKLKNVVFLYVLEKGENVEGVKKEKKEAEDQLKRLKEQFETKGFNVKTEVREGMASEHILDQATREKVTLIVMPKRGAGRIRELILGSTADAVLRKSNVPVLLFPANRAGREA